MVGDQDTGGWGWSRNRRKKGTKDYGLSGVDDGGEDTARARESVPTKTGLGWLGEHPLGGGWGSVEKDPVIGQGSLRRAVQRKIFKMGLVC